MKLAGLLLSLTLMIPGVALAYDIGPAVGTTPPKISAPDQTGAVRDLHSISGDKGLVLVFFRSAKWCPFCQAQLMSLKDAAAPLKERGYGLAGISYDPVDVLGQFTQKREINFTLLSDQGSKSIDAWKLRDAQYPATSFAYGVPEPSIFVLAPNGKVKAKIALQGYKVRPSNADILAMVDGLKH